MIQEEMIGDLKEEKTKILELKTVEDNLKNRPIN